VSDGRLACFFGLDVSFHGSWSELSSRDAQWASGAERQSDAQWAKSAVGIVVVIPGDMAGAILLQSAGGISPAEVFLALSAAAASTFAVA